MSSTAAELATERPEKVWDTRVNSFTPDEQWYVERKDCQNALITTHWYEASAEFAKRFLPVSGKCRMLCVASPIFEATELADEGWDVTYLDVRKPPGGVQWAKGDAADMPFESGAFDALSSSCVICHVGLGRYGDELRENGDVDMMRECKRVLRKGSLAQITMPVADGVQVQRIGDSHRVYPVVKALAMAVDAGFAIERYAIWDTARERWYVKQEPLSRNLSMPDYMSMLLRVKG